MSENILFQLLIPINGPLGSCVSEQSGEVPVRTQSTSTWFAGSTSIICFTADILGQDFEKIENITQCRKLYNHITPSVGKLYNHITPSGDNLLRLGEKVALAQVRSASGLYVKEFEIQDGVQKIKFVEKKLKILKKKSKILKKVKNLENLEKSQNS